MACIPTTCPTIPIAAEVLIRERVPSSWDRVRASSVSLKLAIFSATAHGLACSQQATEIPIVSGLPTETLDYLTLFSNSIVATPFAAFGLLASQEVKDAGVGNLGLRDQRLALYWIQKYICAFGGDPPKVTIWGESAGAVSVALHMVTNDGNPDGLFRAAFMQSGSLLPVDNILQGQTYYDALVSETGCLNASDTLQYLREAPYEVLFDAGMCAYDRVSFKSLVLTWRPRVDAVFITDDPQKLVQQGSVADVPFVNGECDDEGTLFSFSTLNITQVTSLESRRTVRGLSTISLRTDAQFEEYVQTYWLPEAMASKRCN
ncbi:hypothetical protein PAXINDRAFT_16162 [Paxillus involutus ATCC 200175]|uniref:Carboxylic ester hydrolase n=1 Tax=Paxillus involutus ATCC 200175 TaxID=664439 RepID=A0A0C9SS09_PAXIN|nr:hypothetical protein PAXINDRAFT_16162 [Paxillus involutus ATCC 200175]